jgi:hypothetical protein
MNTLLRSETESALEDFLKGVSSPQDFEGWIISCIDEFPEAEQAPFWELRLLLTEYGEGLRPLQEAKTRARQLLADIAA